MREVSAIFNFTAKTCDDLADFISASVLLLSRFNFSSDCAVVIDRNPPIEFTGNNP